MAWKSKRNIAVFIDRDGTIIHERHYLRRIGDIKVFSFAYDALKMLKNAGYKIIIITNQSGVGRGYLTLKKLKQIHKALIKMLSKKGVKPDAVYFCPHRADEKCECRKPKTGMVKLAKGKFNLDLKKSFAVGDHVNDFLLGQKFKGKGIFVLTGHGKEELVKIKKNRNLKPDLIADNLLKASEWITDAK